MSLWSQAWESADAAFCRLAGQEVTVTTDGQAVVLDEAVLSDLDTAGTLLRGAMDAGATALLHLSAEQIEESGIRDGSLVEAEGERFKVVGRRGSEDSGASYLLEPVWE